MKRSSTISFLITSFLLFFYTVNGVFAQTTPAADSLKLKYPFSDSKLMELNPKPGFYLPNPSNINRTVEFDAVNKRYIIREKIGDRTYRPPQYLTIEEYQRYENEQIKLNYWKQLSEAPIREAREPGFVPSVKINSRSFERIFGGNSIDIRPQGTAELTLAGRMNKTANPLFNERQRRQGNFDFDQRIQMNVLGQIGTKLKINTNYNTEAQFDFENQMKLDYTGKPDEIVQKIEAGNVNLPLASTLISGSQSLFGLKTQLQFGKLNVTSIFSQQKSQQKEITINNGSQQNEFRITGDNYEANKHYFLAHYFRDQYNNALKNLPLISSNVNITRIEVWVTNRNNSTTDSRDIVGLIDLGENRRINNPTQVQGGPAYVALPAAGPLSDPDFGRKQSNNLLAQLSQDPANRLTNSNSIGNFFQANGANDNFSKLSYARKLTEREFTLNPRLGYISLNTALNADEVLAVAYRYNYNGEEYQVGEFSTDIAVDNETPNALFVKLLKGETLKTSLPTWDLMMKNVYSLGAYQISRTAFNLNVFRLDERGVESPLVTEGSRTSGMRWLQLTNLDTLNQAGSRGSDGYFDFIEGVTIDPLNGRLTFPTKEPFGEDLEPKFAETELREKYVFKELYDLTKADAQQLFTNKNRYIIKGTFQSEVSSEFQLNAINIPQGSVQVYAGTLPLQEGNDFTVDYNSGRVKVLNQALLNSGQTIRIKMENAELFGLQQRSLFGTRFDYRVNHKLNLGGTVMNLTEKPLTPKINIGEESISNTIWGMDANYSSDSRWLTRLVDKLPFISTKETSSITFSGEFANMIPGHPNALNIAGSKNGASYLDDFEGSRSIIDLKSAIAWQISGTPARFPESQLSNNLEYGKNRARLAFYNIDPIFFNTSNTLTPSNIRGNRNERSNHYVREVLEQEVFPFKQSTTGQPLMLPTLDLAYYPTLRGPYNFTTTGLNPNGTLNRPQDRWGGIFRRIETNDFEALNVEFIELWMMDPFIYKPNAQGGDMYFNLGNISEDILKDGYKSLENGLPPDGDVSKTVESVWGRAAKLQPVVQAFDNDPAARKFQDIGLDGLSDNDERQKFAPQLNQIRGQISGQAAAELEADPASDNFQYYRGSNLDNQNAGILKRYERYNGLEGNSKTTEQSREETGIENTASTPLPDAEDINRDNTSNSADAYWEYKISIRPQDMIVGQNYITDKVTNTVTLANGEKQQVSWYQFKIPISNGISVGNIEDFKSIRFIRTYLTNFTDTTVMRLARMQLLRGEWRRFNAEGTREKVIADPALMTNGTNPPTDNSSIEVATVSIEENGKRTPIPYVVPPGIQRERDYSNFRGQTQQNEQALAVTVKNLRDGYGRAAFRTTYQDFRSYRKLEMFIHAEGDNLRDNDISAIVRIGTDNQDNYYEYELPLKASPYGSSDPYTIWPEANNLSIDLAKFQQAKAARNNAGALLDRPFTFTDGNVTITIKGQPDLSKVRVYMLGIKNPLRNAANSNADDGLEKTAQVWFNELRLTDFDERGGWAATARMNAKLADFGDVTVSGSKSTIGFGSIDKRVSERNRSDDSFFDLSSSLELGKFFPEKSGIKIPLFINWSSQLSVPQFDPRSQDIELKNSLRGLSSAEKDAVHKIVDNYTGRRSINFTNVRKIKTNPDSKSRIWDIENFSGTYAFTEYNHRDYINETSLQKTYKAALAYNFSGQPKSITPFAKMVKAKNLDLLKDFNLSLMPSTLNFRVDLDRLYSESKLRDIDITNTGIRSKPAYNKNFQITRLYGIGWNLTRSLQLDFNATNYGIIDEKLGANDRQNRDTIWTNLKRLGRTTNYNHVVNVNYTVPLSKIPGLRWTNLVARYGTNFNWESKPLFALRDETIGNTIQNSRTIQLNPTLNFVTLYNKLAFVRNATRPDAAGFKRTLVTALTSIKNVTGSYSRTEGQFLPGYSPSTNLLGYNLNTNAPGWDFIFGSQNDMWARALSRNWLAKDTLQSKLYVKTRKEDLNLRGSLEPIKDLRIELTALKSQNFNYSSTFSYNLDSGAFNNNNQITTGDYSVSFFSLKTAFSGDNADNTSRLFRQFEANRRVISQRLGARNPNSSGQDGNGYAQGYGANSQDVVVSAFVAAYTGQDAGKVSLRSFPKIPIPNWRITYNGLTKIDLFNRIFSSFDINHTYRSTYSVNSFNSLARYDGGANGFPSVVDANQNFLPRYQFSQVLLAEQFVPLLGIDFRLKNNMSMNFEYRKSRALSLSLANSQLAQQRDNGIIFGFGYRTANLRLPFGLFGGRKLNNDINFKMDFGLNDRKTTIFRADVENAEVSSGAKTIGYKPSIDYVLNQKFNLRIYYDGTITKPYTSQTFNTSFTNFGVSLRFILQ
ncbi:cell surface protein SprA [Desertivirga brevis]|uniref:T9SS outer membrane translocon Sov/SprA n=1 Tax=Desertivirga brevis TaxID=2810310 RepID=UPI001F6144B5|nr:cell surface protein SprA [Pedobacter sp. SYSU D00873]